MNEPQPRSGSNTGLVVLLVTLLLGLPCVAGVVLVGGGVMFYWAARESEEEQAMTEAVLDQSRANSTIEEQLTPPEPAPIPPATPEPAPPPD